MSYFSVQQRRKWTTDKFTIVSNFDLDSPNLSFKGPAIFSEADGGEQKAIDYCEKYKQKFVNRNNNSKGGTGILELKVFCEQTAPKMYPGSFIIRF
jgi:hypothetical protein